VLTPRRSSLADLGSAETSDEEGEVLITKATQRRKKQAEHRESIGRAKARGEVDDWLVDDDEEEPIEMSSEDELIRTPKRRKPRHRTQEEQEELEADLDDLRDSSQERSARKKRTRGGPVTTEKDKAREHFDALKRRRAGEKIPRIVDSDEEEASDEGADIALIGRPSQQEEDDEGSVHSSVETDLEAEDKVDEDDFIEDDSGGINRPNSAIPLEFTHWASAQPKELFPHIIEWLVKNKIAPAFSRNDDIYTLAFNRIDDQVRGHAGSRLISATWGAEFKHTILARPQIGISAAPGMDEDLIRHCDACNNMKRPARYEFVLSGDAYHKDSLEPVDNDDYEVDYDENGHELAEETRVFHLGSHCAANAQMGHKLSHWKFHLNEYVLMYLEEQGVLSAEAIVARDKLNHKKREREAETIIDNMDAVGKIQELWRDFKADLDNARTGMEDYRVDKRMKGSVGVVRSAVGDGVFREWKDDGNFRYKRDNRGRMRDDEY
jgi:hypothetical protein